MALLLMAGLALVPEDLLKAASMDGANAWKRFWAITVPLIKPAILVALLFRTLDAFRVFDNIYILTSGANQTSSVSMVAYNNLIKGLNLGIGSTMSVLIFITAGIIAFIFVKAFGAAAPGADQEGGSSHADRNHAPQVDVVGRQRPRAALRLRPGGVDRLAVAEGRRHPERRQVPPGVAERGELRGDLHQPGLPAGAGQLDRHLLDRHFIAVVFGTMAAYAIARLDFPGKATIVAVSLLISMFPQIALVTPLFKIETALGLFDTWPGLIIPYITFALPLAIYTLSAFFREIPWDLEKAAKMDGATPFQAFRQVITPLAMPRGVHHRDPGLHRVLERLPVRPRSRRPRAARTVPAAMSYFTGATTFEEPTGPIAAAAVVITIRSSSSCCCSSGASSPA